MVCFHMNKLQKYGHQLFFRYKVIPKAPLFYINLYFLIWKFMKNRGKTILIYFTLVIVSLYFLTRGLIEAKSFLAPLSVAALLAMVVLPVSKWMEKKGLQRGWASFLSDILIIIFFVVLAGVTGLQVKSIVSDWPRIKERIEPKIAQVQDFIADKTGISVREQNQKISQRIPGNATGTQEQNRQSNPQQQQDSTRAGNPQSGKQQQQDGDSGEKHSSSGTAGESGSSSSDSGSGLLSSAGSFMSQLINFMGTFLLIFVYIFFFLLYRHKFRMFILKLVPDNNREEAEKVISDSADIAQNYLFGRLLLILFLAVIYAIGLSVSGVQHAILISVLAALLSLIPYIGNIVGFFLAITMAFISGSGIAGAAGVTITFAIAQFIESYILEPYIVGDKVNLNPVFTIIVVVMGGAIWGITGMLIAIPALGILKIVFNHIPVLQPYGYLFGQEESSDKEDGDDENFLTRTKQWALRKFK